jgi:hypothetical protein
MRNGQNETIDHPAGEANGSRFGRDHDRTRARGHVDASVAGRVVVDRRLPFTHDDMGVGQRPQPRVRDRRRRRRGKHPCGEEQRAQYWRDED